MEIPVSSVELAITWEEHMPGAAGMYHPPGPGQKTLIRVSTNQLLELQRLIATLAHELSHVLLLGGGKIDPSVSDHEWITDLLPVFLGIGIFAANVTVHEKLTPLWWTIRKQGYLPSRILGYALALFAHMRGETRPRWKNELRLDAATALNKGLRFIDEGSDCLFHRDTWTPSPSSPTESELIEHLETGTPSRRLATLWEIQNRSIRGPQCMAAIVSRLQDRDGSVAGEAARTIAEFGDAAKGTSAELRSVLHSRHAEARAGAASALGTLLTEPDHTVPELCRMINDSDRNAQYYAIQAIAQFKTPIDPRSLHQLLATLENAMIVCDFQMESIIIHALMTVCEKPEECIRELMPRRDEELQRAALVAIKEYRKNPVDWASGGPIESKTPR